MICPHCNVGIFFEAEVQKTYRIERLESQQTGIEVCLGTCPNCRELLVTLRQGYYRWIDSGPELLNSEGERFLYPPTKTIVADPLIPENYRTSYNEAQSIMRQSPKSSAALSRRLLQQLLRDEYEHLQRDLSKQIDDFLQRSDIPKYIMEEVDAIRNIGNFAAHPLKSSQSGEIVDVEPGEAEWCLEVLNDLLETTFVTPKKREMRRKELNEKLQNLGKNPMKE